MQYFNLHTHSYSNQSDEFELVNQYPHEFTDAIPNYSIGIHPWFIDEDRIESDLAIIESKLKESSCLAVGDCGLDKRIEIPFVRRIKINHNRIALGNLHVNVFSSNITFISTSQI